MKNLIHLSVIFSHVCMLVLLGFIINVFLCICLRCTSKYAYYSVAIIIIAHIHTHCCFECYINIGQTVSLIFWHTIFFLSGEKDNTQYSTTSDNDIRNKWYRKLIGLHVIVVVIIVTVVWVGIRVAIRAAPNCI